MIYAQNGNFMSPIVNVKDDSMGCMDEMADFS